MSDYTKGPWKFEGNKVGPRSMEDDQSYGMVLPVAYIEQFDVYNYIANARLIAAAPELLEALVQTQALLERLEMESSDEYQANAAAIAKAKGETK